MSEGLKKTVYEELVKEDWVQYFEQAIDESRLRFTSEGKLKEFKRLSKDIPWICTKEMKGFPTQKQCTIYLTYFKDNLGFIHSFCHDCYKVVVKPKTIVQLFKLYDIQQEMGVAAKCGVEVRSYIASYYGGYFYTRSLEEGQTMYYRVRKIIDEKLSRDVAVILKRGCTEFEMKFGASDKWEILPNQKEWEEKFRNIYVEDSKYPEETPPYLAAHIKRKWIHFAATQKIPDMTYKELTGGKPLAPECKYVTYQDEPRIIRPKGVLCKDHLSMVR